MYLRSIEIYKTLNIKVAEGRLLRADDRKKVVLGDDFISNNEFDKKISVGSKIKVNGPGR